MYKSFVTLLGMTTGLIFAAGNSNAASGLGRAGEIFEILQSYDNSSETNGGSAGSSSGRTTIIERVIRAEQDGLELEYSEALSEDGESQSPRTWQLPARIYRPFNGPPTLLNILELEARVDPWLKQGKMTRSACEQWIFTWNAFKIECDPASALGIIEPFNLWSMILSDGQLYYDSDALAAAPLKIQSSKSSNLVYLVDLQLDSEKARIARAETDVIVAKILGEEKTFDAALARQTTYKISGTISVEIEASPTGQIIKRTKITKLRSEDANGEVESQNNKLVVERKLVTGSQ